MSDEPLPLAHKREARVILEGPDEPSGALQGLMIEVRMLRDREAGNQALLDAANDRVVRLEYRLAVVESEARGLKLSKRNYEKIVNSEAVRMADENAKLLAANEKLAREVEGLALALADARDREAALLEEVALLRRENQGLLAGNEKLSREVKRLRGAEPPHDVAALCHRIPGPGPTRRGERVRRGREPTGSRTTLSPTGA